jgi:hypothetical protein
LRNARPRSGAQPARHSDIVAGDSAAMRVVTEVLEIVETRHIVGGPLDTGARLVIAATV